MKNIFDSQNLQKDYALFEKALFATRHIKYPLSPDLKPYLRKYHKLTYIIALFDVKLQNKWGEQYHKFLFISEILSDLLSNSVISIIGFYNSSKILTRRIIENFYNHIYYFDHPIEYELLNMGRNEYTPLIEIKKYFACHPIIITQIGTDDYIKTYNENLMNYYHDLCKHVHTKGVEFMDLAKNLSEIKPEIDILRHFDLVNNYTLDVIYLLYKFHPELIFTPTEKLIISTAFNKQVRRSLS